MFFSIFITIFLWTSSSYPMDFIQSSAIEINPLMALYNGTSCFDKERKWLYTVHSSSKTIDIYNTISGELVHQLPNYFNPVTSLTLHRANNNFLAVGKEKKLYIIHVITGICSMEHQNVLETDDEKIIGFDTENQLVSITREDNSIKTTYQRRQSYRVYIQTKSGLREHNLN